VKTARRIAAMEALTTVAGLVTLALGITTGNWPMVMIGGESIILTTLTCLRQGIEKSDWFTGPGSDWLVLDPVFERHGSGRLL